MEIRSNELLAAMAIEKNQNLGGRFGATSQTALPIQPIWPVFKVNRLNWQCCLAGSSKTAPKILIFSIAMGTYYSFYVKAIAIYAPTYFRYNTSVLAIVHNNQITDVLLRLIIKEEQKTIKPRIQNDQKYHKFTYFVVCPFV